MKHWIGALAFLLAAAVGAEQGEKNPPPAEWVRGTVVKTDTARSKVILQHERIKSIRMEAMTMPFKVADAAQLATLKAGDKVRFAVALKDDELLITDIKAAK